MTIYAHKPTEVHAWQWNPGTPHDRSVLTSKLVLGDTGFRELPGGDLIFWSDKSSAWMTITPGDWVIKEMDGKGFYPCTADAFERSYELAR